ncbi:hypothetical protein, partial [Caballeronia glathei]|uniref:hypothetical protein n=1 Tax=Caballeronia glathei TaxID=60547 RepID=UPI0019D325C9
FFAARVGETKVDETNVIACNKIHYFGNHVSPWILRKSAFDRRVSNARRRDCIELGEAASLEIETCALPVVCYAKVNELRFDPARPLWTNQVGK